MAERLPEIEFSEKVRLAMEYLVGKFPRMGEIIQIGWGCITDDGEECLPEINQELIGYTGLVDYNELHFLIFEYLVNEAAFLHINNGDLPAMPVSVDATITPAGWQYIDQTRTNRQSKQVFVAASFEPEFEQLIEQIVEAIHAAGYDDLCLKDYSHNENIINEIITGIRKSRFVIADFSIPLKTGKCRNGHERTGLCKNGHCEGVYWEAGFARGMNTPVIHTVRANDLNYLHFDTKQTYHIRWENDDLDNGKFKDILTSHINATIH
jgi:hypothetical protein